MSKLEKYPKYKDSGVEWLGEIPEEWEVKKIKAVLKERKESNKPIKTTNILSLCMYRGVIPYAEKGNAGNKAKNDLTAYKLAYPGDIVLNSMNVIAGSVGLSKYFGAVSPVYYMLNPRNSLDKVEFFNDIFQSEGFQKSLTGLGNGILIKKSESTGKLNTIRMRIPMDKLNSVLIPYPPSKEQAKIANYLNQKIAQIDKAISLKEQMIERLKERRQILINDAVTKGLDKTVKMRDSGVEWLGEVPEGWEVKKLKYIIKQKLKYGANESGIEYKANLPRYVRITDFSNSGKLSEKNKLSLSWEKGKDYLLKDGDILFARSGATVGKTYQFKKSMSNEEFYSFAGYLIKAEANEQIILSNFLYLYTNSDLFERWKEHIFNKATIENIGADKYSELFITIPSIKEQEKILHLYSILGTRVDRAIALQEQQIEKLKEYKATLIDSVVTGKVRIV